MLPDTITLAHPGTPSSSVFSLLSVTGTNSIRVAEQSTDSESENLIFKHKTDGKAGQKVTRHLASFDHLWVDDDSAETHCITNFTTTVNQGIPDDALAVAWRQFCRLVGLFAPAAVSTADLDEWVVSDNFKRYYRGEP